MILGNSFNFSEEESFGPENFRFPAIKEKNKHLRKVFILALETIFLLKSQIGN